MINTYISKKVIAAIFLTLILLMLGAFTRLSDAGLGCPDWPLCYGKSVVSDISQQQIANTYPNKPLEIKKAWTEMAHRYVAGVLGLLILWIMISAIRHRFSSKDYSEVQPLLLPISLVFLIIFQALLGMWTVTKLVHPIIVTLHLLGGMAIFGLLWLLHLRLSHPQIKHRRPLKTKIGLILIVLQIALGGLVSTNYAALACVDFPGCYTGQALPNMDLQPAFDEFSKIDKNYEGGVLPPEVRASIHMIHRISALIIASFAILFLFNLRKSKNSVVRHSAWWFMIVLTAQISIGIASVYLSLPLFLAVAHNGFAALLLLTAINLWYFSAKKT